MKISENLKKIADKFKQCEEVEAVLLAGSYTANTQDQDSDYDLYVYTNKEIPLEKRKEISDELLDYVELNNQFWETEDNGIIKEDNIPIDIIYRSLEWLDEMLERVMIRCQAEVGYTTCFWSNLLKSTILYDKTNKAKLIQAKYDVNYPQELKRNIIAKNYPLLKKQMPAYYYQIEKAIKRKDDISVNHRIAALLASYFDILFAVNELPHPGEKKLVRILKNDAKKLPIDMEEDLNRLMRSISNYDHTILRAIDKLVDHLDILLQQENLMVQ